MKVILKAVTRAIGATSFAVGVPALILLILWHTRLSFATFGIIGLASMVFFGTMIVSIQESKLRDDSD